MIRFKSYQPNHTAGRARPSRVISLSLAAALGLGALASTPVLAGDCDGGSGDDVVVCTNDGSDADLKKGNDNLTQNAGGLIDGHVIGDGLSGTSFKTGGDDTITINGEVTGRLMGDDIDALPGGQGGNDLITIGSTGTVDKDVRGDDINGVAAIGGNDTITVDGSVGGDVYGDYLNAVGAAGGDDIIEVNGTVEGDVIGDGVLAAGGTGGNDQITINGTVNGNVEGDGLHAIDDEGGDDLIIIGENAEIGGTIKGGSGNDTLSFKGIYQDQLDGLDPAGDSISQGGHTYTWVNFETLLGLIRQAINSGPSSSDEPALTVFYTSDLLAVIEADDGSGIDFYTPAGRILVLNYADLAGLAPLDSLEVHSLNQPAWYYIVENLGVDPGNSQYHRYQVSIYNAGVLVGQFSFSYF